MTAAAIWTRGFNY
jgi:hypothetical protein